jgi:DNA-binding CsgD family transcriptional regulator
MIDAFHVAAAATRDVISSALEGGSERASSLLKAALAHHVGDVGAATRPLWRLVETGSGPDRAAAAEILAAICVMRHDNAALFALADILRDADCIASAHAFRALASADSGSRDAARRQWHFARAALATERDEGRRMRVMQRLAWAAFLLDEHEEALNLAATSAALSVACGAWTSAAAAYSLAYLIHYSVTADCAELDRYVQLLAHAALQSGDESMIDIARVAQYDLAVQRADEPSIERYERLLKSKTVPEPDAQRFTFTLASAIVRGAERLREMRLLLEAARDMSQRSRGEWALCTALIAVAQAADGDDESAQRNVAQALSRLGRALAREPAYEQHYRRFARVSIAVARILLGDDALALRTLSVHESRCGQGEQFLPGLMQAGKLDDAAPMCRGFARVFATASAQRARGTLPAELTRAEYEVLRLLSSGWTAVKIARETHRSVNTIYNHTRAMLQKLDVSRASEAVAVARTRGLLF